MTDHSNLGYPLGGGWGLTITTGYDAEGRSITHTVMFSREQAFEIAKRIVEHFVECPTPIAQAFKEADRLLNDEHWKIKT